MSEAHVVELKRARALIASGETRYVCNALTHCTAVHGEAVDEIIDQITLDLEFHHTLEVWMKSTTGIYPDGIQETRLAWIDAMIEYWKDKP